jgi:hypothetical protein
MKGVVSSNGVLVPIRDAKAPEWMAVSGVTPEKAKELMAAEAKAAAEGVEPRFTLVDPPEGVETVDIPEDPAPEAEAPAADARDSIVIPDDWKSKSPAAVVKLAKKFDPAVTEADAAVALIETEIARRAEAKA